MAAIKCTCIYKFRDNNGNIKGYRLQDKQGQIQDMESDKLKSAIRAKQIDVDNLTLTVDNRLMSKTAKDANSMDLERIAYRRGDSPIGVKYQKLFKPAGIEVVTAVYLAYPKEGDDINSIFRRTFKDDKLEDIRQLVVDPSRIVGEFSTKYDKRYEDDRGPKTASGTYSENMLMGGETDSHIILLVLYKDGGFRTVIFGEFNHLSNLGKKAQDIMYKEAEEYTLGLSVITLNSNKQPVVTNVGTKINEGERQKLISNILGSHVDLWLGQDATRNILAKIDARQAAAKLKRIGIGTFGIPFAAVALLGVAGMAMVGVTADEIGGMNTTERMVFGTHGFVGVDAMRRAKEKAEQM